MTKNNADHRLRDRRATASLSALLAAHAISQTGNVVTAFAVPFYVLGLGGSGFDVGIAAFFATVPVVVGGALGGVVVDRVGHRRAAIVADLVSGAAVLAIPVLALTVGLPFWSLLLLVFAGGLLDTPGQTARRVMLPKLTARAGVRLEQSVGLLDGSERFAKLIGASIAGLLVASVGPIAALFVNAATFAVSALLTWTFVAAVPALLDQPETGNDADPPHASYWSDLAEGFRFVIRDPLMRLIVGLVLFTNLLDAARGSTLMPLYANDRLDGAAALGLLVAVMGGCALVGNIAFGFVAHRVPRRSTLAVCFALAGGPSSAAFAVGAPLPVLVAMTALSGLAAGAINPILGTVELERVPEHMRGRVFGLINAGAWAGVPFGALLGGIAADTIGLPLAFGIIAVVYTLVTLSPLTGGSWTHMERRPDKTATIDGSNAR
ncbi:MFS transporter [Cryobacterium levicorallinum]|uniref:MFS transporter n=1 Tax=Cryobacterium levicorallinum TaxID=995038 RepID=A0A1I3E893_9MICO|nr:MFS transporter [Cryobacterium levicorallinum]TFB82453.1 MFS transporter [Cryobacterium levicorallinum]GEP28612.1 putative drug antiporter protein precursor [Cryobacterium levicorallinum]SFH95207.1 Major Facilitator Superfamily protein [Cryobacterium levicorallinum]